MLPEYSTGVCTSGAPDGTPFIPGILPFTPTGPGSLRALVQNRSRRFCHANHSYGYALRSKGAPSDTPDAHPSGIFMQLPG